MPDYIRPIAQLIAHLEQLPGIGMKSAERIAFHLMRSPQAQNQALADAVARLNRDIHLCRVCYNLCESDLCAFCADPARDHGLLCVVEEPRHLMALERAGEYRGVYHVLLGALAPLDGVGPDALKIDALLSRLREGAVPHSPGDVGRACGSDVQADEHLNGSTRSASIPESRAVREVILATDPDKDGEATALYLAQLIKPLGVKVTRIASGVPVGGNLDYADGATLGRALVGRQEL